MGEKNAVTAFSKVGRHRGAKTSPNMYARIRFLKPIAPSEADLPPSLFFNVLFVSFSSGNETALRLCGCGMHVKRNEGLLTP